MASRVAIDIGGRFTELVYLDASAALDGVEFVVNGTTVGINTLSERTGAEAITTLGFRDVLEIGKGNGASSCRRSPPRSSAIPASSVARAPLIPGCFGVLTLAIIGNGFDLPSIDPTHQQLVQGALILFAVAIDQLLWRT